MIQENMQKLTTLHQKLHQIKSGETLYKINDIGKFEGFDMKEINKIVINNIQKNEELDNLKRLYDFTFNEYNCFSKIYELIAIIDNLDLSSEENVSNVYNSIKFDLDDIPISVNWSYEDDINITFKEQTYCQVDEDSLKIFQNLCTEENPTESCIIQFPIYFIENGDIFYYKEYEGKENTESNYVEAIMIPNKEKIKPNISNNTKIEQYLNYKNNKLGFHIDEFNFFDFNSTGIYESGFYFYWFVNIPKNLNDLQIGMETEIEFFNSEHEVKIADTEDNKIIIKKYKEGTKKEKIIVLQVQSNAFSKIDRSKRHP